MLPLLSNMEAGVYHQNQSEIGNAHHKTIFFLRALTAYLLFNMTLLFFLFLYSLYTERTRISNFSLVSDLQN